MLEHFPRNTKFGVAEPSLRNHDLAESCSKFCLNILHSSLNKMLGTHFYLDLFLKKINLFTEKRPKIAKIRETKRFYKRMSNRPEFDD